jgi:hypothetical protein
MSMSRFLHSFVQLFQHDRCANYLCGCNTSVIQSRTLKMYVIYQRLWMVLSWWITVRNFSAHPYKTGYELDWGIWDNEPCARTHILWFYAHEYGGIMFFGIISSRLPDSRLSWSERPQYEYILSRWKSLFSYVWRPGLPVKCKLILEGKHLRILLYNETFVA